jgi:hypothetical protein
MREEPYLGAGNPTLKNFNYPGGEDERIRKT